MKKPLRYLTGLAIFVTFLVGIVLYCLFSSVVPQEGGFTYYLKPGTSKKAFLSELSQQGIIQHPLLFSFYIYPQKNAHLKTGEYLFPKGSSLFSIWRQVTNGTGLLYHPFTIIPGWSFNQLRHALAQTEELHHLISPLTDKQVMERISGKSVEPEGEFFPETYYYTKGLQDLVILKRAYDLMQSRLHEAWLNRSAGLPFKGEYEALIAASLVEKEAYRNDERPLIASVMINRLRKDMLLQFDPTVIYGMGERYTGKIHKDDLLENTPYNTYVHKGLPPTPIAMPSMVSINAVLHPQQSDFLYFVAKGDGSHQFSRTLLEHNAAVKTLIKQPEIQHQTNFNESKVRGYIQRQLSTALKNSSQNIIYNFEISSL